MAIYHNAVSIGSRGSGQSACASSAYISCSVVYNDYDGIQHDYTRKGGLIWEHIFLPPMAPAEWQDRETLWNAVESAEKSKDNRLSRMHVVALPVELGKDEWIPLLTEYIQTQFVSDGMCVDVAIHDTDGHNPHAHIMTTLRPLNPDGTWQHKTEKEYICIRNGEERGFTAAEFKEARNDGWQKQYPYLVGKKKVYMPAAEGEAHGYERASKYAKSTKYGRQNPITARWNSEEQLQKWRVAWEDIVNYHLEHAGSEERIDHRSHAERGLDEKPTIHEGVAARIREKKGEVSDRCELNRQIRQDNRLIRELKALIKKLSVPVKEAITSLVRKMETVRANIIQRYYHITHNRTAKQNMTDKLNKMETRYGDYKKIHARKIQERRKLKSMIEEKNSLSPIHVFQHKELDRKIHNQEAVIKDLIEQEKEIMSWFGKTDAAGMKEISADITRLQERITDADQAIEDSKSRIEEEKLEYVDLSLKSEEYDLGQVKEKCLEIRPEMEKKIIRNIEKGTGKKVRELDLAESTTKIDKSLRSLVRTKKQKLMEKGKTLSADPAKPKKEKTVDDQQKRA